MKLDDARRSIIAEWRDRRLTNRQAEWPLQVALFFAWVRKERSYLLAFESEGEKSDTVQAWLEEYEAMNAKQAKRNKSRR